MTSYSIVNFVNSQYDNSGFLSFYLFLLIELVADKISDYFNYTPMECINFPPFVTQALRFYASYDVKVRNIRIINSPQCHLKFDNSGRVNVTNITISSPEDSPNTDGIHLQNTQDVEIQHSNIGCGK